VKDGIEADDTLGILCTHPKLVPGKRIVVTIDKDLLQIPGHHYNPDRDEKRVVSLDGGDRWFFQQVLTGDATDNYPGCPGIGPKRASGILDATEPDTRWSAVVAAYKAMGLTEANALVQARLARILRHTDYDFERKEPILWSSTETITGCTQNAPIP
jgi:DNA polymerase I